MQAAREEVESLVRATLGLGLYRILLGIFLVPTLALIPLVLLHLIVYAKGYVWAYQYFGFNPFFVFARFPKANLVMAGWGLAVAFFVTVVITILWKQRFVAQPRYRIITAALLFLVVSVGLGCAHSVVYYLDREAYLVDGSILKLQKARNEATLKGAQARLDAKKGIGLRARQALRTSSNTRFAVRRQRGPHRSNRTVFSDNYVERFDVELPSNTGSLTVKAYAFSCLVELASSDTRLMTFGLAKSDKSDPKQVGGPFELYSSFCSAFYNEVPEPRAGTIAIALDRMLVEADEQVQQLVTNRLPVNLEILTWDLFAYDTLLKSLAFGQGYYKSAGLLSRSLTLVHAVLFCVFTLVIIPMMYDYSKSQRVPLPTEAESSDKISTHKAKPS